MTIPSIEDQPSFADEEAAGVMDNDEEDEEEFDEVKAEDDDDEAVPQKGKGRVEVIELD